MHTVTLEVKDNTFDTLMNFIKKMSKDEIKIIEDLKIDESNTLESLGGALNKYANEELIKEENRAWELHIEEKYK